jgi:hypothetical protein
MSIGYTFQQINDGYNALINKYKDMGFVENPYNVTQLFGNVYGCTELFFNDKSIKIVMERAEHNDNRFSYPVSCVQLKLEIPDSTDVIHRRFYYVDNDYYLTDLDEIKKIRKVQLDRFLNRNNHTALYCDINKLKLSNSALSFLKNRINQYLLNGNRTLSYQIKYIYFSYRNLERQLIVVIKHDDKVGTEAIYF